VILDTVGGNVTGQALSGLGPFGRLVHLGYSAGTTLTIDSLDLISKPCTILGFNILPVPAERSAADLDEVIALAAQGKYRSIVGRTFPMAEVAEATRYLDERRAFGKGRPHALVLGRDAERDAAASGAPRAAVICLTVDRPLNA
jgi:NADPH2:quinone reductase